MDNSKQIKVNEKILCLVKGDITHQKVDVIVNAANEQLVGGGGVDGAIHRAAGPSLMVACDEIRLEEGGCQTGGAAVTHAGELTAKHVFHAVGPVWKGGDVQEAGQLESCYRTCFALARELGLVSMAFPSISTGVYGYPVEKAASIAVRVALEELREATSVSKVSFVLFNDASFHAFAEAAEQLSSLSG